MQARPLRYLLFVLLALPAFLPFNFIYRFGVNVPFWDQWDFVPALVGFHEGRLTLDALTMQHNEHRLVFPRLIMLGLSAFTGWDTRAEMYFNAVLLVALCAVLLHAHVRAFGASNRSLLAFLPVPWWVFTFRQYENLVWGWQLRITLCALCCVVSLLLLDGVRGLGGRLAGATAAAVVSTYSFGSGSIVWPVGLGVLLWQGRREGRIPWRAVAGWGVAGALAIGLYAWNYRTPPAHPDPMSFLKDPGTSILFLLNTLGAPTSETLSTSVAFGVLLLAAIGVVLVELRQRRVDTGPVTFALALVLLVGAAAFLVLVGRGAFGREFGGSSRYTTLMMLGFIGLHRAALTLQDPLRRGLLLGVLLSATVATGLWSFTSGITAGYNMRATFRQARQLVETIDTRKDAELQHLFYSVPLLRQRVADLERLGLSIFPPPPESQASAP